MCGLTGFLGQAVGDAAEVMAARMAARLVHRGPDDGGVWVDAEVGIAMAHRRLAVVDLSAAGRQPMHSASGRFVLAYNGEIYNHLDLRRELEACGRAPTWRGHSDTETLLAAVEVWGLEPALKRCVGMFALALWDRERRELLLARDRMGEKPLYYGWQHGVFLFGSELKSLRAHPAFEGGIDRGALALLLRRNFVPGPHSIYQGISKLPPGSWLRVSLGDREGKARPYWSLAEVAERGVAEPFEGDEGAALDKLAEAMGRAVREQCIADVPLGALLSGGIDSSLITALMQSQSNRPVRTFTIGFEDKAYDEAVHARAVAAHLGTDHTELRLSSSDALELIPGLPAMYDEPFADSSQLPTHLVMRLARQHVTVALSGDAGDELFGGYNRYFHGPAVWKRIAWLPAPMRRALGAMLVATPAGLVNRVAGPLARQVGILRPGDQAHKLGRRLREVGDMDDLFNSLVNEWSESPGIVLGARRRNNLLDDRGSWPRLLDPVARMMALDALTYLPDDILVKVDRAAMAVSLETRAPFLDHRVVELAWRLPKSMKLRDGKGKWILRQLLDRYVPRDLIERPKMGFGIPLDAWLRGPLRDWAEALLAEDRLAREGYFDPGPIRSAWLRHQRGEATFGYRLWSVLMFQAWLAHQALH